MIQHLLPLVAQIATNTPKILALFLLPSVLLHQLFPVQPKHSSFGEIIEPQFQEMQVKNVSLVYQTTYSKNQATTSLSRFLGSVSTTARFEVQTWLIEFEVELEDGSFSTMVAEVFSPVGTSDKIPFVVSTPGTTGLTDSCAPSREPTVGGKLGNYENQMVAMASQGFLVVQPNYIGLDNPEIIQEYFIKDSAARSVLGSVLAIRQISDQLPGFTEEVVVGGYSQGGHVAFSTADLLDELAPSVIIAGVFGHGPTTDTKDLLKNNPNLAPYFAYTYSKKYPDFNISNIFQSNKLFQVERAPTLCVNQAHAFNSANISNTYTADFGDALRSDSLLANFSVIEQYMTSQDAGTNYTNTPTLILQGTGDPIVTLEDQARFAQTLCQRDIPLEMKTYAGVHHFQTRQVSFWDTLNWINRVYAGTAETDYCV